MSKRWSLTPSYSLAALTLIPYLSSSIIWLLALKEGKSLVIVGMLWSLLASLATTGIGLIVFHEQLTSYNYYGLILAMIALILLVR
jgi:multidrug transporter EmrE-like cation transporter